MPPKRKRNERASDVVENRPSPHRPQNTNLGQHESRPDMRDTGRRSSRGGQGGLGGGRGRGRENPNKLNISGTGRATPGPMSPPPRPSSATQTPTQISTPTAELPSPLIKRDPAPFDYAFLTDDRVASWDSTGRRELTDKGIRARQDEDAMDLSTIFQELTRATLDGRLDAADTGNCLKDILGPEPSSADGSTTIFDPHTFFLDIFSMLYETEDGPMNPALRTFLASTGISPTLMRQKLDNNLLQDLLLTRDTFSRVGVRQATNLLYRQANYNLLREETEGYSKLVTELFTTSASEPPTSEVVEDAFERVKGLIGTFDLDVGRVLDITLDVFAAVLIKHFRFFIKLLRVSSWWPRHAEGDVINVARLGGLPTWALPSHAGYLPTEEDDELFKLQRKSRDTLFWARAREVGLDAYFELGGREMLDEETKNRLLNRKGNGDAELDADRQWIQATGTLPPSGNRVAAQLLGFKLRFYTSDARDKDDILPANLIYLTALLIKIGFISLRDLYAHLWPLDEDMPAVLVKKRKELEEKERLNRPGGGASNALTMAGALPDDTLPNNGRVRESAAAKPDSTAKTAAEVEDPDKLDEPTDQKVQLLVCLLTIGAIPESLFILGRFPWLPEAYPELIDLVNRILHYSIKDVYDATRPSTTRDPECPTKKIPDADQNGVPKGHVRLTQLPPRKQLRWPFPDRNDTNESNSYRFYWDEWADNVPVCQNVDDMFTLCGTLLHFSGVGIGKDVSLLSKLARIGTKSLTEDSSRSNLDRWQDLLKRLLVPALSLTKSNTAIVNEIYEMLRFYPLSVRYAIYAEWFEGQTSRLPLMKTAFERARLETLSTMKRISLTNLTTMAKTLAKTAYSSPGVVFSVALSHIEAYQNLTEAVVECAKYFTDLGYDVLVWSLVSALGGKHRNRTNAEFALLPSRWLLALSQFSGKVFKRYSIMNLSPVIQYINDQLYRGNSMDLVILKELISQMAGIVPDTDFTDAQLTALTGGEALRKHTLMTLQDKRYESGKTSKRLMRTLTETKISGALLIAIAQHRQAAIYKVPDEDAHIKLLATMIDDTQLILSQYLDLLRSNFTGEEFDEHVPGIPELMIDFGLEPALAFMIGRSRLADRIAKAPSPVLNGVTTKAIPTTPGPLDAEGDISMEVGDAQSQADIEKSSALENDHVPVTEDAQTADLKNGAPPQASPNPTSDILGPIVASVNVALPEGSFKAISPEFYVTFWTSTLGHLSVSASYNIEIKRLGNKISDLFKDNSDKTRPGISRKNASIDSNTATRDSLQAEYTSLVNAFPQVKARILANKEAWFRASVKSEELSDAILEKCLLPRLLLSPSDADFSFKMIKFLHDNAAPHFRTLSLYTRLFRQNRLRTLIFTCTVREAENLGRFLKSILADLASWHASKSRFEKEAWGPHKDLPGFAKSLDADGKPRAFLDHDGPGKTPGFKSLLLMWHKALNSALRDCLDGTEWMHIKNAMTVLKSVVEVFPAIDFQGLGFIKQLEAVATREKGAREDLSLTANAVLVQLKKRSKKWVMIQAFHMAEPGQVNGSPSTPRPNAAASKAMLNAGAPEFKPQSRASSLGVSTPKPMTSIEVEDGEVDDAKTSAPATTTTTKTGPTPSTSSDIKPAASTPAATMESRKSDILDRREQIKRENAAKAAAYSAVPPRPDSSRNSSILDRASPNLPSRPDAPFPSRQDLDRHSSRHLDRRDGREPRLPDPRGPERPGDRSRDFSTGDRRPIEPTQREFGRTANRGSGSGSERERVRPDPPPRWTADSARENLDRSLNGARATDSGRLSREMPPPRSAAAAASDRGPPVNPERLPLVNPERQEIINPERAALISGEKDIPRSDSPRRGREDTRDRTSSRPQSPRRHASEKDYSDSRRDDRSTRTGPPDVHNGPRGRIEDPQPPPAGPRSDRPMDRANERSSNDRSAFQPSLPTPRSIDPDHGRLNAAPRQQPDPNFGRLNPAPSTDIPSGPRDRTSRGNRMANPAPPRREGRAAEIPRPPTPEKQPPTGPSSRHPRRSASGQFDPVTTAPVSAPTTPAVASPAAIHPDRLKHLGPSAVPPPPPQSQPAGQAPPVGPGVHPDRLKAFGNESPARQLTPSQMNNNRSRPHVPPVMTTGPPSGPKGLQQSPVTPGMNGVATPTGPAAAADRAGRGPRRQLAGINTMLQQAGQQNGPDRTNTRGRGRNSSGYGLETPISAPSTAAVPPPPPPPPGPPPASNRPEGVRDPALDLINPQRADLITGSAPDDRERDRNGRRERSGRHSRRSSRSPERERDSKRKPEEYRDRRAPERGEPERDRHPARSSPARDLIAGRDNGTSRDAGRDTGRDTVREGVRDSGRDVIREGGRDREREGHREAGRRDGREREPVRDAHEGPWNAERGGERGPERGPERGHERGPERGSERGGHGRSRDMRGEARGEERRDSRGSGSREDGSAGRKRRSDEGMDTRGHDKRQRRG